MSTVGDDVVRERACLRTTLLELGPDAPTMCGDWTTTDLAVHIALGELRAGLATVPFRLMVARGISLDRVASGNTRLLRIYRRRRGFDWAIERLGRPTPRMHQSGRVAVVTLLELWAHHEDALLANGLTCDSGVDLGPVVELLRRYQRKAIAAHNLEVSGSLQEQARVLAGRADIDGIRLGI